MKKTVILFAIALLLSITAVLCLSGCGKTVYSLSYDATDYISGSLSANPAEVKELEIEWINGNINFVAGGDAIVAQESGKSLNDDLVMRCRVKDGVASIKFMAPATVEATPLEKQLTITVPSDFVVEKLTVKNTTGSVSATVLAAKDAYFEIITGHLYLTNFSCEKLSAKLTTGGAIYKKVESKETKLSITTGNFQAISLHCNDFTADTTDTDYTFADLECARLSINNINGNMFVGYGEKTTGISVKAQITTGNFVNKYFRAENDRQIIGDGSSIADFKLINGNIGVSMADGN